MALGARLLSHAARVGLGRANGGAWRVGVPPLRAPWGLVPGVVVVALMLTSPPIPLVGEGSGSHPGAGLVLPLSDPPLAAPSGPGARANGTFYVNQTQIATFGPANADEYCLPGYVATCYPNSADPSILSLPSGQLGLAYETTTTASGLNCPGSAGGGTMSRVGFSVSSDGGRSFPASTLLGDSTTATCPYFQQLEPSFALQSNGSIDGVYVGANESGSTFQGYFSPLTLGYTNRTSDALVFVQSFDNGSTFTDGTVLLPSQIGTANLARPAIASFGRTIYVAFENISNGSSYLTATTSLPIAVQLAVSTDGGSSWTGPYILPGENATAFNSSFSPSVGVSANGTLAVSYLTNRQCVAYCSTPFPTYGDDVVVVTSATNGSSFSLPSRIATVGETGFFGAGGLQGPTMTQLFQYGPSTSAVWDPSSGELYVAYSGATNLSIGGVVPFPILLVFDDWADDGVWVASSSNGGTTWISDQVGGTPGPRTWDSLATGNSAYFSPGVGSWNGTIFATFTERNLSAPGTECGVASPSDFGGAYYQLVASSADGRNWTEPTIVDAEPRSQGLGFYNYPGYSSSVAFTPAGRPVLAYSIGTEFQFGGPGTIYDAWNVSVATPYTGPVVNVTFSANGLPSTTGLSFALDGETFTTSGSNLTIDNIPKARPILIRSETAPLQVGFGVVRQAEGGTQWTEFSTDSSWVISFTDFVAFLLTAQPGNVPSATFILGGSLGTLQYDFFAYWSTQSYFGTTYYYQGGCPLPWYLPAGFDFTLQPAVDFPTGNVASYSTPMYISYWTGTGPGGYSGAGPDVPIAISTAMVNETFWMMGGGSYGVRFSTPDLPLATPFSFALDGSAHVGLAGNSVLVSNVTEGPHTVTNVSARSARAGWEYFGFPQGGNPVNVPQSPEVNLSFSEENLTAPAAPVAFRADGLGAGTPWELEFNGTVFGSDSPWINVTARSGVYPVAGFPVTSENGSATFLPAGLGSSINVTAGGTIDLEFAPAYELSVLASSGGSVTGAGARQWGLSGTTFNLTAHPDAGYGWGGWTGTGAGSYTGPNETAELTLDSPVVESATFYPLPTNRFNITFVETGIPNGTSWTVYVNGRGFTTTSQVLTVADLYGCGTPGGGYQFLVPYAYAATSANSTRYVPTAYAPTGCGGETVPILFVAQFFVDVGSTGGGSVEGSSGWYGPGDSIFLGAVPAPGSSFAGWDGSGPGSYTGPDASISLTSIEGPIIEIAGFVPLSSRLGYTITFVPSAPLPAGTQWAVEVDSSVFEGGVGGIRVSGLAGGSHTVTPRNGTGLDGLARVSPVNPSFVVTVRSNLTEPIDFTTDYWVDVQAAGPGTVATSSGWWRNGSTVELNASPALGAIFVNWTGSGPGAYTGTAADSSVIVQGPLGEAAAFAATSGPPATSNVVFEFGTPILVAVVGIGIVVGAILVVLFHRRSGQGSPRPREGETDPDRTEGAGSGEEADGDR